MPRFTFNCEYCGKLVENKKRSNYDLEQVGPPKFCSRKCSSESQKKRIPRTCEVCGTHFEVTPSYLKSDPAKYCSHKCYHISKRNRVTLTCDNCGGEFETIPSEIKKARSRNSEVRFCSRECWREQNTGENNPAWQGGPVTLVCEYCGKEFEIDRGGYAIEARENRRFCSLECKHQLWREDPTETPNWKGGVAVKNNGMRKHWKYSDWRTKVFERDDYTCQKCGERGVRLHAHHLYKYADFPHLRLNVRNGHTLCEECHLEIRGDEDKYLRSIGLDPKKPPLL